MKTKIVKVVAGLTLVSVVGLSAFSCAKKNPENYIDALPKEEQSILDGFKVPVLAGGQGESSSDTTASDQDSQTTEEETSAKIEKYKPLDFQTVSDFDAEYDSLVAKKEEYNKTMKNVVALKGIHSTEEIAYAIYNVVKVDNDLSCLLLKIYEQRLVATENQVYLADQIESLEDVLNKMKALNSEIDAASRDFESALSELSEADVKQIERVQKFSKIPLTKPIKQLEKKVKELKEDLKAALSNQP